MLYTIAGRFLHLSHNRDGLLSLSAKGTVAVMQALWGGGTGGNWKSASGQGLCMAVPYHGFPSFGTQMNRPHRRQIFEYPVAVSVQCLGSILCRRSERSIFSMADMQFCQFRFTYSVLGFLVVPQNKAFSLQSTHLVDLRFLYSARLSSISIPRKKGKPSAVFSSTQGRKSVISVSLSPPR
jgi:hypothetical protein